MKPAWKTYLCYAVFFLAMANFFAFCALSVHFGGDAVNGYTRDGHYFLGAHGHYREVSEQIFNYSLRHAHSVWITHPLGIFAAWLLVREEEKTGDA
jgi:hypothetical protein